MVSNSHKLNVGQTQTRRRVPRAFKYKHEGLKDVQRCHRTHLLPYYIVLLWSNVITKTTLAEWTRIIFIYTRTKSFWTGMFSYTSFDQKLVTNCLLFWCRCIFVPWKRSAPVYSNPNGRRRSSLFITKKRVLTIGLFRKPQGMSCESKRRIGLCI